MAIVGGLVRIGNVEDYLAGIRKRIGATEAQSAQRRALVYLRVLRASLSPMVTD